MPKLALSPALVFSLLCLARLAGAGEPAATPTANAPPWEVWRDLRRLAVLDTGVQTLQRSSHCLDGCGSDKHAPGDPRFIRLLGDEGVIFDEVGPGAITRIWMTTGGTSSEPLDPAIRLRFTFDGEAKPRLDLPLPGLFDGKHPPFTAPLVADRLRSSGGFVSLVPIPFARRLVISLEGATNTRLWFQFTFQRLPADQPVMSFSGQEDLAPWRALLQAAGSDPWPAAAGDQVVEATAKLAPGEARTIFSGQGPGLLTGLKLFLPRSRWPDLTVELSFDGETTVALAANDFFAAGGDLANPPRSLLLGADAKGVLYSYFPLPFASSVSVRLLAAAAAAPLSVSYGVRRTAAPPLPGSGRFGARLTLADPAPAGADLAFLDLNTAGKWVGLAAQLGAVETLSRKYLEGDERLYIDGRRHPAQYGTGVEDLFGGGFYFDQGTFGLPLHGMTAHQVVAGEDRVSAYRLLLSDAVPFHHQLRAGLEPGSTGDIPIRARIVAWYYTGLATPPARVDRLDVSAVGSREAHAYASDAPLSPVALAGLFEGEPARELAHPGVQRPAGSRASFQLDASRCQGPPTLRRLFDVAAGGQAAEVLLAGKPAGGFAFQEANPSRRWRELDLVLPSTTGPLDLTVQGPPAPPEATALSEVVYELWCAAAPSPLFADGFESGDTAAWTTSVGLVPASP